MSNGKNDKKVTGKLKAEIKTSSRSYAFNSQDVTINQSGGTFYYQAFHFFWDPSDLVQVNISFPETTKAGKYLLNGKSGIYMSFATSSENSLGPYKAVSGEIDIKEDPTASTLKAVFEFKGVTPEGKEATIDKGDVSIGA
ncbi:hypothetical protein [Pseudomonas sp. PS01303]|jgi:hypothetical protein|uniref:hypothetical protein n=1 Tax=Pseudomonas sp. PS01303 TaxID=2991439 RepID=UPI00249C4C50|nr:hypothetical protein [Pseudomonas sp. PS01303]